MDIRHLGNLAKIRRLSAMGVVLLGTALWSLFVTHKAAGQAIPGPATALSAIQDNLLKTWDQYRLPRTLHCKMDERFDSGKPSMMGPSRKETLEYWMSGTNWHCWN